MCAKLAEGGGWENCFVNREKNCEVLISEYL